MTVVRYSANYLGRQLLSSSSVKTHCCYDYWLRVYEQQSNGKPEEHPSRGWTDGIGKDLENAGSSGKIESRHLMIRERRRWTHGEQKVDLYTTSQSGDQTKHSREWRPRRRWADRAKEDSCTGRVKRQHRIKISWTGVAEAAMGRKWPSLKKWK